MAEVSEWSPTAGGNDKPAGPPDWPSEGQTRESVNNCMRENMAANRRQAERGGWFDWGHTIAFVSATSFTADSVENPGQVDLTAVYQVGRRVLAYGPGSPASWTAVGTITSSTHSTVTTVVLTMDAATLQADLAKVEVGVEPSMVTPPKDIPAGTRCYFDQNTAPDGWTFQAVSSGDYTLRPAATEGQGGTTTGPGDATDWAVTGLTVGTAITNGLQVDPHTLTVSQLPAHTHQVRLRQGTIGETGLRYLEDDPGISASKLLITDSVVADPAGVQGASQAVGSDQAHPHTLSGTITLADGAVASTGAWRTPTRFCIICSKD